MLAKDWMLVRRSDRHIVAKLRTRDTDFPWVICDFEPVPEFESYRALFEEQSKLMLLIDDDPEAGTAAYDEINRSLELTRGGDAKRITEFLMHIVGDQAHFRWIDEGEP